MNADSFQQLLDRLTVRTPFRPFTIELMGGGRFEVDHARAIAFRGGMAVYIAPGAVPIWFDHEGVSAIVDGTAQAA